MSEIFALNNQLREDSFEILNLELCKVLLMNNCNFPWLILVPQRNNLKEIIDLEDNEQIILIKEIVLASKALEKLFTPYKLNIAALGNIVEQLHIHIIARYKEDIAWPKPVFGCEVKKYELKDVENLKIKLKDVFNVR